MANKTNLALRNVAAALVEVDGAVRIIGPKVSDTLHSEGFILQEIQALRRTHGQVNVRQILTERIPCGRESQNCRGMLAREFPGATTFAITERTGYGAADSLARAYGLKKAKK